MVKVFGVNSDCFHFLSVISYLVISQERRLKRRPEKFEEIGENIKLLSGEVRVNGLGKYSMFTKQHYGAS